jgi:hypothetical protein
MCSVVRATASRSAIIGATRAKPRAQAPQHPRQRPPLVVTKRPARNRPALIARRASAPSAADVVRDVEADAGVATRTKPSQERGVRGVGMATAGILRAPVSRRRDHSSFRTRSTAR